METNPLTDKHMLLHPRSPFLFFNHCFLLLPSVSIHPASQAAQRPTYQIPVPAFPPEPSPAINQQQGWRGQTEEPTQPAQ